MLKSFISKRGFAFFNKKISTKFGEKCCRYNQNGKPLDKDVVLRTAATAGDLLKGW